MPYPDSRRTEARRLRKPTPAPYGQACINCARAKCKCLLLATGDQCERCDRLGKECGPSLSVRRSRQGSSSTRIARSERSLEGHAEQPPSAPSQYDIQTRTPVFALPASDVPDRKPELSCIYIPLHVTPQELMQEKPFFWYCLTAVLTPNLTKRESLFTKVHDTIYQKLVLETTPSMDLLLGLMTFMSW
ncbi:hypothetical protein BDV27DRAFT_144195 [Aspergillus caelatus]|uniref:Zn(2)-C6 fungal-type domain-containing protein n=1 Tax=Aspergillus caelatus TaxID=61420 RepID=A0A5N7A7Z8_9EURO|nr:uncharacterized protein BDV27DRAFT_144195 [Aspergillus caelatus]KAE8365733.1 hypothetical protein BDV27DRAFT_144195 [Aspergillus caelatus]